MCGISGLYLKDDRPVERCVLKKMTDTIAHRGPDDEGIWVDGSLGLGHRRLSIIDLSQNAHQPMVDRDGSVVLAFNGEIYNFRDLRRALMSRGVQLRSGSDTEVILEGYRAWGDAVLQRLNGMFAIALVDVSRRRLLLARDRFGVKPLYYAFSDEGLVFGSEIKVILASRHIDKAIDGAALSEYLHYSSPLGVRTFYQGIRNLEPGQALSYQLGKANFFQFSKLIPKFESKDNFKEAVATVRYMLEDSVKRQLVADVPVGIFLSGGVDSSAIAMLASKHSEKPLQTFSADFEFAEDQSERELARLVANRAGSKHTDLRIGPENLIKTIDDLVVAHDQPFGDAANVPIALMCRAVKNELKVVLQGDGGDELFAGYSRYGRLARQKVFQLLAMGLLPLRNIIPKASKAYRALRSLNAMGCSSADMRMALLMSQEPYGSNPSRLLSGEFCKLMEDEDPFLRYREMYFRFDGCDPVQAMLYTDTSVILPDVYFPKVDRASMMSGIEVRVPMMDNDLVAYALSLPSKLKLNGGEQKALLKAAMRGVVPDRILEGKKKGFGVPVSQWLRGALSSYMRDIFSDSQIVQSGMFDREELARRVELHISGSADYGQTLYKMLNLAVWYKRYMA